VATPVRGGLRLSGRWGYASGSPHATWASLGAGLADDAGQVVDAVLAFVPVAEVTLEETWLTVGHARHPQSHLRRR
jgi:3-hydroxy-9,10-secoandrosta-1,3,5(10)-triene-9,17-dione monooxygenase